MNYVNCIKKISLILLLAVIFQNCKNRNLAETAKPPTFEFEYTRYSSFLNWNYIFSVNEKGSLTITESKRDSLTKSLHIQMEKTDIQNLENQLKAISKISLKAQYGFGKNKPTDLPVECIIFRYEKSSGYACIYFTTEGEMPAELKNLLAIIGKLISTYDQ